MNAARRVLAAIVPLMAWTTLASAQSTPHVYVGGTLTGCFETQSYLGNSNSGQPFGGNTWNGSVLFGGWVARRIGAEMESSFGPRFYLDASTDVQPATKARRDTFWSGQVRVRVGGIEPVFGLAYHRVIFHEHSGPPYTTDGDLSANGVAAVLGFDAPIRLGSRTEILPTFRMLFAGGGGALDPVDPAPLTTSVVVLRYGAGVRVRF